MHKSFPFCINNYGHIHEADEHQHVREMMEQILFTLPGERVNRPEFGCGLQLMVFGETVPEVLFVKQANVHSELQKYLSHLVHIDEVKVSTEGSQVNVLVRYALLRDLSLRDQQRHTVEFKR